MISPLFIVPARDIDWMHAFASGWILFNCMLYFGSDLKMGEVSEWSESFRIWFLKWSSITTEELHGRLPHSGLYGKTLFKFFKAMRCGNAECGKLITKIACLFSFCMLISETVILVWATKPSCSPYAGCRQSSTYLYWDLWLGKEHRWWLPCRSTADFLSSPEHEDVVICFSC